MVEKWEKVELFLYLEFFREIGVIWKKSLNYKLDWV